MCTAAPSADRGLRPIASSRGLSAAPLPAFHGGGVFCTPGRSANEPNAGPRFTLPPPLVELVVPDDVELDPPPPLPQPASRRTEAIMARWRTAGRVTPRPSVPGRPAERPADAGTAF